MPLLDQIPQIDYTNLVQEMLPVSHRTPRFIAWNTGIIKGGIAWINKNMMNYCYGDSVSTQWDNSITYLINETVLTYRGVYISTLNGNLGNNPYQTPTYSSLLTYSIGNSVIFGGTFDNPTYWICSVTISSPELFNPLHWTKLDGSVWYKISPTLIGAQERVQISSQKMTMEFELNRQFRTTYRIPTSIITGGYAPLSDIYITTVPFSYASFGVTSVGQDYGAVTSIPTIYGFTSTSITILDTTYEFIVWIPISLSVALGSSYIQIVSQYVSKWCLFGTIFSIQTY